MREYYLRPSSPPASPTRLARSRGAALGGLLREAEYRTRAAEERLSVARGGLLCQAEYRARAAEERLGVAREVHDTDEHVFAVLRAGAGGSLSKDDEPAGLRRAVAAGGVGDAGDAGATGTPGRRGRSPVSRRPRRPPGTLSCLPASTPTAGDALLSPGVTRRVIERFARRQDLAADAGERLAALTTPELEVVRPIALGLSSGEIAKCLVISPLTTKAHVVRAAAAPICDPKRFLVDLAPVSERREN